MPTLRKDDGSVSLIKEVFDEIKDEFFNAIRENLLLKLEEKIHSCVEDALQKVVAKKNDDIVKLQSDVEMLQQHVKSLKEQNEILGNKCREGHDDILKICEENEQYSRRLCLRGIPTVENEKSEDVLEKVREIISENQVDIPDTGLDRAHRVGPVIDDKQCVIVRFSTFRHRTLFFRKRKDFCDMKVRLDLTKRRYKLLRAAQEMVESNENIDFVFADINCRLKVRFKGGKFKPIESLKDLELLIAP